MARKAKPCGGLFMVLGPYVQWAVLVLAHARRASVLSCCAVCELGFYQVLMEVTRLVSVGRRKPWIICAKVSLAWLRGSCQLYNKKAQFQELSRKPRVSIERSLAGAQEFEPQLTDPEAVR
jgi:hypothetical protein